MRKVVSLSTYLEIYNITREDFDAAVKKNKGFYAKYIEWGSKKDGSDTIISPRALEELGKCFNGGASDVKQDVVSDTDKKGFMMEPEINTENTEINTDNEENTIEKKGEDSETKQRKGRKKKSKFNITKQFINESGKCDISKTENLKQIRRFLMNDGIHKAEDVALLTDAEISEELSKNYFVIAADTYTYIIDKKIMSENADRIFVMDN